MDFNAIIQAIASLGFPIVMCLLVFWKMNENQKEDREYQKEQTKAITNLTVAVSELREVVKMWQKKEND